MKCLQGICEHNRLRHFIPINNNYVSCKTYAVLRALMFILKSREMKMRDVSNTEAAALLLASLDLNREANTSKSIYLNDCAIS